MVSQANPHGESVAMAADLLAIAVAELGGVAERRLDRLVNPLVSGLPAFLVGKPGVNSGMMITQYVAASLAGENRQLAQPAVVDNFVTSALQEDHLSLGTSAALELGRALENLRRILAIEYLLAAQPSNSSPATLRPGHRGGLGHPARARARVRHRPLAGSRHRQRGGHPRRAEESRPAGREHRRPAMKRLWQHCHAATLKGGKYSIVEDAALVTDGPLIHWIGPRAELPPGDYAERIDLGGAWLTPG